MFIMGIKFGNILDDMRHALKLQDLSNQIVGIDAYVMLYQFLARIRQEEMGGAQFTDALGRETSHLIGLFYRSVALLEEKIKLVFVFDGEPPEFKRAELERRANLKQQAEEERLKALEEGDEERAAMLAQRTVRIDEHVLTDTKKFLDLMGIPYLTAKHDAEAQLAAMAQKGVISVVASQDYDTFLFGAPTIVRNLTISQVRTVKGQKKSVVPEKLYLDEVLKELAISREQLIYAGMLLGTDFNKKIPKVGPATAIKLVREYPNWNDLLQEVTTKYLSETEKIDEYFQANPATIINYFMQPPYVEPSSHLHFRRMNIEGITQFLVEEHNFDKIRVEQRLKKISAMQKQKSLESFF